MNSKSRAKLLLGIFLISGLFSQTSNLSVMYAIKKSVDSAHTTATTTDIDDESTAKTVLPSTYNIIKIAIETDNSVLLQNILKDTSINDFCNLKFKISNYDLTKFDALSLAIIHGSINIVDFLLYDNPQVANILSLKTASVLVFLREDLLPPILGANAVCMDMFYEYMEEQGYEVRSNGIF